MMKVSRRIGALEESQSLQMAARCQQLRAAGVDVIGMSLGEPDFAAPEHIKAAAKQAVDDNFSHYGPTPGFLSLRQAIADSLNQSLSEYAVRPYSADEIIVTVGAKQAICTTIQALIDPEDEVILPTPCWVSYGEMVKLAEGKSIFVKTKMENAYCLTPEQLEQAITPRTRLLLLCTPNNPTGAVYSRERLAALVEVLKRYPNIVVLADEIYAPIQYAGKHESLGQFPEIEDRVVIVNGVSKAYAMTGYRIGWMACHATNVIGACTRLQGQMITCATTIAQKAAEAAYMGPQECVAVMREAFHRRRDLIVRLAKEIPDLKIVEPKGAFYLFPDMSAYFGKRYQGQQTVNNANELVDYLLNYAHVACVSGSAFGDDNCIRFSYATSEENIIEAMRRVKIALSELI